MSEIATQVCHFSAKIDLDDTDNGEYIRLLGEYNQSVTEDKVESIYSLRGRRV